MSMNLQDVACECIQDINSNVEATWYQSTGNTSNADGSVTPEYAPGVTVSVQMQAVTSRDLRHTDALNLQGQFVHIWLDGMAQTIVQLTQQGGDKFVINGQTWLTIPMPEQWQGPGWTHCIVQLQVQS
jgi:hypothetical protein